MFYPHISYLNIFIFICYAGNSFSPSPQTCSAISFTSSSFAHWSLSVSSFPSSVEANPHCVLRLSRSRGIYLLASLIRAITSALSSNSGNLEVIRPSTTCFSPETFASGSNLLRVPYHTQDNMHQHLPLQRADLQLYRMDQRSQSLSGNSLYIHVY